MSATSPSTQEMGPCPCGCSDWNGGPFGTKLTRQGHLIGCVCKPCQGRRNQRKGKAGQAKTHRNLGGTGFTPSNEESARPYQVEVTVMPEVKTGAQIPTSFERFITSAWFQHALRQSEKAVPVGSGARPCVVVKGEWAIVDIRPRRTT